MKHVIKIWAYYFAILIAVSSARGLTIPASEDTTGYLDKLTMSANASPTLIVDANRKSFLYFNLDEVPQDALLRWAKLRLFLPAVRVKGGGLGVYLVTSQWDEALASTQPTFSPTPVAVITPDKLGTKRFVTVDLTSIVQDWIRGGTPNEGLAIAPLVQAGTALASVILSSKEGIFYGLPAELDLEFNSPTLAAGPQGPPGPAGAIGPQGPKGDTGPAGGIGSGTIDFSSLSPSLKALLTPTISGSPGMISPGVLGVNALGVGTLSYQWLKDGVEIAGGTGATYALGGAADGVYSMRVSNAVASTFSDAVRVQGGTLAGAGAVSIVSQPQGAQVLYGPVLTPNVALSVDARSSLPIAYQWKRNGVAIAGATSGTYTAIETGTYTVVASDAVSSVTSTSAEVKWLYKVFWGKFLNSDQIDMLKTYTMNTDPVVASIYQYYAGKLSKPPLVGYLGGAYSGGLVAVKSGAGFKNHPIDADNFDKAAICSPSYSMVLDSYQQIDIDVPQTTGSFDLADYESAFQTTVAGKYKVNMLNAWTWIFAPSDMPGKPWSMPIRNGMVDNPDGGWVSGATITFNGNPVNYQVWQLLRGSSSFHWTLK